MKVLCACEESQVVCIAFRALGHEAYSCDIQEPSGGHPEWHILGDALKAIEGGQVTTMDGQVHDVGRWDMIIAFPPCTKTSNAGARHLYKGGRLNLRRYYEGLCGKAFCGACLKIHVHGAVKPFRHTFAKAHVFGRDVTVYQGNRPNTLIIKGTEPEGFYDTPGGAT